MTFLEGKHVVAPLREIQEVKNAIRTYELYTSLDPFDLRDLLKAHGVMMEAWWIIRDASAAVESAYLKVTDVFTLLPRPCVYPNLWKICSIG